MRPFALAALCAVSFILGAASCWLKPSPNAAPLECAEYDCKYDNDGNARQCECYK